MIGVLEELSRYHADLTYEMLPDRTRAVDIVTHTVSDDRKIELKANDSNFTYYHGDAENDTWSYEYNFASRTADLIVGTSKTHLPIDNMIPFLRSPTPKQLQKMAEKGRSKRNTIVASMAIQLEKQLYAPSEHTFAESVVRSLYATGMQSIKELEPRCPTDSEVAPETASPVFLVHADAAMQGVSSMLCVEALDFFRGNNMRRKKISRVRNYYQLKANLVSAALEEPTTIVLKFNKWNDPGYSLKRLQDLLGFLVISFKRPQGRSRLAYDKDATETTEQIVLS